MRSKLAAGGSDAESGQNGWGLRSSPRFGENLRQNLMCAVRGLRQRVSPNRRKPGNALPTGFGVQITFGLRHRHGQAQVAYLVGELPCLVVDAPANEKDSWPCGALHGCLVLHPISLSAFRLPNHLDAEPIPHHQDAVAYHGTEAVPVSRRVRQLGPRRTLRAAICGAALRPLRGATPVTDRA